MAGFFGLFGSKTKYVDEEGLDNNWQNSSESFYLSSDDAKTLGNIDYMRTAKKIKHTFPKTASNKNTELTIDVSSIQDNGTSSQQAISRPAAKAEPTIQATETKIPSSEKRRSADRSMDIFRNMAREIKK